eukprot:2612431-Pyramimonas_sp.AAC.1
MLGRFQAYIDEQSTHDLARTATGEGQTHQKIQLGPICSHLDSPTDRPRHAGTGPPPPAHQRAWDKGRKPPGSSPSLSGSRWNQTPHTLPITPGWRSRGAEGQTLTVTQHIGWPQARLKASML